MKVVLRDYWAQLKCSWASGICLNSINGKWATMAMGDGSSIG